MKVIKVLSKNIEDFIREYFSLIFLLILASYIKLSLYLFNYKDLFITDKSQGILLSFFRFFIFSLSFTGILFLFTTIISFIIFLIGKKLKVSIKKPVFIISILLEIISYIYIYADLQLYKLMGVHLHNKIVLGALNNKDLNNDVALTFSKIADFLIFPLIIVIFILLFFFLFIYFKNRFNLNHIMKKITAFLSIPIVLSLFLVTYFLINLSNELTAIPLWSYIEVRETLPNKETTVNYSDKFDYNSLKIKNKKNIIIIIAETFRKDVFNKENTPNMFKFTQNKTGFINSNHHFSGTHFTVTSIFSLWYSIWGYHYQAILRKENYKHPIPIKIFNKLNYDTLFLTSSLLIPSYKKIKTATKIFKEYKTFKNDEKVLKYFQDYYKSKDKNKPFLAMVFFKSTHFDYKFPKSLAKYKPYLPETESQSVLTDKKNYKQIFNRYRNSVLYIDSLFKRVTDTLTEEDKKNTIIIFIGDHGEEFWEYGKFGHTRTTYIKEVIELPLIFYIPDLKKDINIKLSSNVDIMTTLLSYITNINTKTVNKFFNGISLLNPLKTKNNHLIVSSFHFMGLKGEIALVTKNGKLILKSKTDKLKDKNLFKIIKFIDFNDKKITNKQKKDSLIKDFNNFKKTYLKFINTEEK